MPYVSKHVPTKLIKRYRAIYGVHYNIGHFFKPHITLGKLKKESDSSTVKSRLGGFSCRFCAREIAIAQINRNHQVTRILKRFRV